MVLHPPRMHWSAQQVLPCEEDTPQAWGAQGLGPQPHGAPSRGPHDLEGHLLGSDSELGFSQERGGCRRSPLAGSGKTGVHRQLRLTGSQGGGQQAVGSCAASVVWERSPRSSSQRFSVVGSGSSWHSSIHLSCFPSGHPSASPSIHFFLPFIHPCIHLIIHLCLGPSIHLTGIGFCTEDVAMNRRAPAIRAFLSSQGGLYVVKDEEMVGYALMVS